MMNRIREFQETLEQYKKKGYTIFGKKAMGVLTGLSKDNCNIDDIRKVVTPAGIEYYISDKEKKIILPKDEYLLKSVPEKTIPELLDGSIKPNYCLIASLIKTAGTSDLELLCTKLPDLMKSPLIFKEGEPIGGAEVSKMIGDINAIGQIISLLKDKVGEDIAGNLLRDYGKAVFKASEIRNLADPINLPRLNQVDLNKGLVIDEKVLIPGNGIFGKKNLLLVIDMQLDFCRRDGKLYVMGGESAENNLVSWININKDKISDILLTRDDHYYSQIGMYSAWLDGKGRTPDPFTVVSSAEVEKGTMTPRYQDKESAIGYLKKIESAGSVHRLWPLHCIHGSAGQQFSEELQNALRNWSEVHKGAHFKTIDKGSRDDAEMYSVFSYADGSMPDHAKTILDNLAGAGFDKIFIAGLAKDICVAASVKDLVKDGRFKDKLVFLGSCMESINTKAASLSIYREAVAMMGAKEI
jgi:nicotinamidase-related amidase